VPDIFKGNPMPLLGAGGQAPAPVRQADKGAQFCVALPAAMVTLICPGSKPTAAFPTTVATAPTVTGQLEDACAQACPWTAAKRVPSLTAWASVP
jgi:hypothetical protein